MQVTSFHTKICFFSCLASLYKTLSSIIKGLDEFCWSQIMREASLEIYSNYFKPQCTNKLWSVVQNNVLPTRSNLRLNTVLDHTSPCSGWGISLAPWCVKVWFLLFPVSARIRRKLNPIPIQFFSNSHAFAHKNVHVHTMFVQQVLPCQKAPLGKSTKLETKTQGLTIQRMNLFWHRCCWINNIVHFGELLHFTSSVHPFSLTIICHSSHFWWVEELAAFIVVRGMDWSRIMDRRK